MIMKSGSEGADNFLTIDPPPPNTWQLMMFLDPLDALIPKIPFSFFAEFRVRATSGAPGVSLSRILAGPSIGPFGGGGGGV